jgi:signal peptidase I
MSAVDAMPNPKDSDDHQALGQQVLYDKKRHCVAAAFSAIVPGSGQMFLGTRRRGILLLVAFGGFILAIWPFGVLSTYVGYVISVLASLVLFLYSSLNALLQKSEQTSLRPSKWWLLLFVPLGILSLSLEYALLGRAAGFRSFSIPSISMERTLVRGDRIIADMHYYRRHSPNRGDIVILYRDKTFLVKRVVAIGSDTIQGINGSVAVNRQVITEPYVEHSQGGSVLPDLNTFGPMTIPPDEYFVMGDNRDVSYDSRSHDFGLVRSDTIVGKPLYIFSSSADRTGTKLR